MKKIELYQMENVEGGGWFTKNHSKEEHLGCAALGLAAGIASLNPLVGGLTVLACYAINYEK